MKFHMKGWALAAAVALVVSIASTAMAIESFQERFEWGDMSKPTTLQGRVIVLDPYDEAVWINIAVFGGNAESGLFWQKVHPGKNLKFYADKGAWEELEKDGPSACRTGSGQGSASGQHDRLDRVHGGRDGTESPRHYCGQEASGSCGCPRQDDEHFGASAEGLRREERGGAWLCGSQAGIEHLTEGCRLCSHAVRRPDSGQEADRRPDPLDGKVQHR